MSAFKKNLNKKKVKKNARNNLIPTLYKLIYEIISNFSSQENFYQRLYYWSRLYKKIICEQRNNLLKHKRFKKYIANYNY